MNRGLPNPRVGEDLARRVPERGGSGAYGTNSNRSQNTQVDSTTRTRVGNIDVFSGPLEYQVRRQDNVRIITTGRQGYYHYNPYWRDDYFFFRWYWFDPFTRPVVLSPWYWYPHLPPYICVTRVVYIHVPVLTFGSSYRWVRPAATFHPVNYSAADYAIDDLVRAFERGDMRLMSRIMHWDGRVHYYWDGRYEYSMFAEDFYTMIEDLVEGTWTQEYRVLDVRRDRGHMTVFAEHVYFDAWNQRRSTYHMVRLREVARDRWQITDFGTGPNRWRF